MKRNSRPKAYWGLTSNVSSDKKEQHMKAVKQFLLGDPYVQIIRNFVQTKYDEATLPSSLDEFNKPNYAYKRAYDDGYAAGLKKVLDLLEVKDD